MEPGRIFDPVYANDQISIVAIGMCMMYKNIEMLAASNGKRADSKYARLDYVASVAFLTEKRTAPPTIRRRRLKALRFETEHIK